MNIDKALKIVAASFFTGGLIVALVLVDLSGVLKDESYIHMQQSLSHCQSKG